MRGVQTPPPLIKTLLVYQSLGVADKVGQHPPGQLLARRHVRRVQGTAGLNKKQKTGGPFSCRFLARSQVAAKLLMKMNLVGCASQSTHPFMHSGIFFIYEGKTTAKDRLFYRKCQHSFMRRYRLLGPEGVRD